MKKRTLKMPSADVLERELQRSRYKDNYKKTLKSTVYALIVVTAVSIIISMLILPVFRVYGTSMNPTLEDGDIIIALKASDFSRGDIIAFYYNNKILLKRVIAHSGDWVDIDSKGNVKVNGELLDEPYVAERALGECDISFPYQVPEGKLFVLGDHRSTSIDSRSTAVGCIPQEKIVGKLIFRLWPFGSAGKIK